MLASLKDILGEEDCTREEVLGSWHRRMEVDGIRSFRVKFFESVMERAEQVNSPKLDEGNEFKRNEIEGAKDEKGDPIAVTAVLRCETDS